MSWSRLFRWLLVPTAFFSLGAPQVLAQDKGTIQGRVFLEGTREPIAGATLRAEPPLFQPDGSVESLAEPVETVTDDSGRFNLLWIRSGIWRATVSAEGYQDSTLRLQDLEQARLATLFHALVMFR